MAEIIYEPLRVADPDLHVTKSIDQCPPGLMLRELLQNAFEAELEPDEDGIRRITITAESICGAEKLVICNYGRGMSPDELVRATDLASSIRKKMGLEGRENRGEGAKVASLPWNYAGFRMRSCRAGSVSEVMLKRVDERYVREALPVDDEARRFDDVWDVTHECVAAGIAIDRDWTEVALFGRSIDQDTLRWPYGRDIGRGDKRTALTEVVNRYYDFPANAGVYATNELHGRKSEMELRPMARVIRRWASDSSKLRAERVNAEDGIEIEFVHLPLQPGGNIVVGANELAGDATRMALVWHNEMYDAHIGPEWRHVAAGFGVPYVHRELSIFIHLPESYPVRDSAYRQSLVATTTGETVECEDFAETIRSLAPNWVRELVERAMAPRQVTDMKEVERELAKRLREARITRVDPLSNGGVETWGGGDAKATGSHSSDAAEIVREDSGATVVDEEAEPDTGGPKPHSRQEPRRKVKSARQTSLAPRIIWLDQQDKVELEELQSRAAKYVRLTNELFMNALHPSVTQKIADLERHYHGQVDLEQVRPLIEENVRVTMALTVGTAVVHALAKQGRSDWLSEDIDKALSPESLTISAENTDHLLGQVRQRLGVTAAFKAAKAV